MHRHYSPTGHMDVVRCLPSGISTEATGSYRFLMLTTPIQNTIAINDVFS